MSLELSQQSSWSRLINYNNINNNEYCLSHTPVCSDNDYDDDDDNDTEMDRDEIDDCLLSNLQQIPGAKQWYMAFPSDHDNDDQNELKHNISNISDKPLHTKSEPTIQSILKPSDLIPEYSNNIFSNNNSLSSFDFDINTENLQQQQTDIFSSATYNAYDSFARLDKITKNQLYSEGVNINNSSKIVNDDCINDGNITMMGYMNINDNIVCDNNNDESGDDQEILINDEGTNDGFTQLPMIIDKIKNDDDHDSYDDDDDDDDDLDGFVNNKYETLMGQINTNYGSEESVDEDDDIYFKDNNNKKGITLMGDPNLNENKENKIDFNFNINEIGITLMGHFENGVNQKIPFKKIKKINKDEMR